MDFRLVPVLNFDLDELKQDHTQAMKISGAVSSVLIDRNDLCNSDDGPSDNQLHSEAFRAY